MRSSPRPRPPLAPAPLTYLITAGETTRETVPASEEFGRLLDLIERAAAAELSLIQIREKNLAPRVLYALAERAARLTAGGPTRLLINDRADIALAAGADGVHLTSVSLAPEVVRRAFGSQFIIGLSAHSLAEAARARDNGADFATIGPLYATPSKAAYGEPLGAARCRAAALALAPFPLVALGGITVDDLTEVAGTEVSGVAAIRLFNEAQDLTALRREIERAFGKVRAAN